MQVGIVGVPFDTVMKKTKSIEDSWLPGIQIPAFCSGAGAASH